MGARWRLRRWLVLVGALAAVAAAGGGAAGAENRRSLEPRDLPRELSATNASGPVITPQQAGALVNAFWPVRERALASGDQKTTDLLEEGVAREYDDAVTFDDRNRGGSGAGLRHARKAGAPTVFVPRQLTYPASFLALVSTEVYSVKESAAPNGQPWYTELLIFTRRDADRRWMLSFDTGFQVPSPGPPTEVPVDIGEGFDADPLIPDWVDPAKVHGMLVDYWQHWKDTNTPPPDSPFLPGFWTTQRGSEIGKAGQDKFDGTCGCSDHVDYRTDPRDGRWQFAWRSYAGGPPRDLVCSTVRIHTVTKPRPGHFLYQTDDRDNWGGWLKPGTYTSLDSEDLRQSCILIGPTQADGLGVIGGNGETVNVTGVRASGALEGFKMPTWLRNLIIFHGLMFVLAIPVLVIVFWRTAFPPRVSA